MYYNYCIIAIAIIFFIFLVLFIFHLYQWIFLLSNSKSNNLLIIILTENHREKILAAFLLILSKQNIRSHSSVGLVQLLILTALQYNISKTEFSQIWRCYGVGNDKCSKESKFLGKVKIKVIEYVSFWVN